MTMNESNTKSKLVQKLLVVVIGGWAIASLASVEHPNSVTLIRLEQRIEATDVQVLQNVQDIRTLQQDK